MNDVFPILSTTSLKDAKSGSIVSISKSGGTRLALVTDQASNGGRSFVWLNPNFKDVPSVVFAENWQVNQYALQYESNTRFELSTAPNDLDPTGRDVWETAGVVVSIDQDLFIRAAQDTFYGSYKLVNIRNGAVYSGPLPNPLWSFLSWQLWVRDPIKSRDFLLTEFHAAR